MLVLSGQEDRIAVQGVDRTTPSPCPRRRPSGAPVPLLAPGVDRDAAIARLKAQPVCTPTFQYLIFALLFVGFAVKVPIVPLALLAAGRPRRGADAGVR